MARVLEISPAGAAAASLQENVNSLNDRQREAFGADLALSPQTPQAQWSGIVGLGLSEVGEAGLRAALYGSSVDHAVGVALDAHGSLLDISRRIATRSRVTATLTGVAGVFVPAGSLARTEPGGIEFRTLADAVLSPAGVMVDMESVLTGPQEAEAGTLTRIVTVIAGWETIRNAEDAALGVDRQTDEEFRRVYFARTAHSSIGPLAGLEAAIEEALAGRQRVVENPENQNQVFQEWTVGPHAILVISEEGSDGDVRRAVENHRGMGVGTMAAIRGGTPDTSGLSTVTNGSIVWNGTTYTGLDFSGDTTDVDRAATLTAALTTDEVQPTISFINGQFVALFRWRPDRSPGFSDPASANAGVAAALGLAAQLSGAPSIENGGSGYANATTTVEFVGGNPVRAATGTVVTSGGEITGITVTDRGSGYRSAPTVEITSTATPPGTGAEAIAALTPVPVLPAGPFIRPTTRALTVTFTLTVRSGFPADGLNDVRRAVRARVAEYGIGEEVWLNDLLCAAEEVRGTRVTNFTVQSNGEDVSGVAVPLDRLWSLAENDLTITVVR